MRATIWERVGPNLWANPARTDYLSLGSDHPLYEGKAGVDNPQTDFSERHGAEDLVLGHLVDILLNAQVESDLAVKMAQRADKKVKDALEVLRRGWPGVWETYNWSD